MANIPQIPERGRLGLPPGHGDGLERAVQHPPQPTRTGSPAPAARRPARASSTSRARPPTSSATSTPWRSPPRSTCTARRWARRSARDQLYAVAELVETQAAAQEGAEAAGRSSSVCSTCRGGCRCRPSPPAAPADRAGRRAGPGRGRGEELQAARPAYLGVEPPPRGAGRPAVAGRAGGRAAQGRRQDPGVRLRPAGRDGARPPSRRARPGRGRDSAGSTSPTRSTRSPPRPSPG